MSEKQAAEERLVFQCNFCEDWQLDLEWGVHDHGDVEWALREHVYDCVGLPAHLRYHDEQCA